MIHDGDLKSVYTLKEKRNWRAKTATYYTDYVACGECRGAPNVNLGFSRNQGPSQAAVNHSKFILREVRTSWFSQIMYPTDFCFENFPKFFTCPQTSKLKKVTCPTPKFRSRRVGRRISTPLGPYNYKETEERFTKNQTLQTNVYQWHNNKILVMAVVSTLNTKPI